MISNIMIKVNASGSMLISFYCTKDDLKDFFNNVQLVNYPPPVKVTEKVVVDDKKVV